MRKNATDHTHTTQAQCRDAFWLQLPLMYRAQRRSRLRQNDYNAAIRTAWVDYIDHLQKGGEISEALADRVTL